MGYSEHAGAGALTPAEVTIDGVSYRVTEVSTWTGLPGLAVRLTAGACRPKNAALTDTDFVLEADEYVLVLDTAEFSLDDAALLHLDTTGEDDAYTGVVAAYWWVAGLALTDGETVALRVERRERPEEPQFAHVTTPEVLVKNTGKASTTLGNPLSTTFPKSAQAFQTGTTTGGYTSDLHRHRLPQHRRHGHGWGRADGHAQWHHDGQQPQRNPRQRPVHAGRPGELHYQRGEHLHCAHQRNAVSQAHSREDLLRSPGPLERHNHPFDGCHRR